MNSANIKGKQIEELLNNRPTRSSLSEQCTSLSVFDISIELQQFFEIKDPDGIISSFHRLKQFCNTPDDLLLCETFYPLILPILESTLHAEYIHSDIQIESLSILNDVSPKIALNQEMLNEIIYDLYSLIYDFGIQEDYQKAYEYIFSILINFIHRGGIYYSSISELLHIKKFLHFLDFPHQRPIQHAAVVFITSLNNIISILPPHNMSEILRIIQQNDFMESDRLHLIKWLLDHEPTSFLNYDSTVFLTFLHSIISSEVRNDEEDQKVNQITAINCLITIINNTNDFFEFDYKAIFRNLLPSDGQYEIDERLYICSLRCIIALANTNTGLLFLTSSINLKDIINDIFLNGHPLLTQKCCLGLLNAILKSNRDFFYTQIFEEYLIVSLINLLDADDDISLISMLISPDENGLFPNMIGDNDNPDELNQQFFAIFVQNGGWDKIIQMKFNDLNIRASDYATIFVHSYYKDAELPFEEFDLF